jgi:hypothetical protein
MKRPWWVRAFSRRERQHLELLRAQLDGWKIVDPSPYFGVPALEEGDCPEE